MSPLAPLLADVDDLIKVVLAILFLIVPVIWGVINKLGRQPQQQPRGGRPGARPPGRAAAAGRPPGGGLEDEIGEFLRRAAQHRQGQPPPPPRPAGQPGMERPVAPQLVQAEIVRRPALGEEIKQHVGEYLDAGEFRRRAAELGGEVAQADERIEQRLRAKFEHEVSTLASRPGEAAAVPRVAPAGEPEDRVAELPSTAGAGLAAMLSNPEGIRQAIVISEVLTRPEDRWR